MKNKNIYNGINNTHDGIIEGAEKNNLKVKRKYPVWIASVAVILVIILAVGTLLFPNDPDSKTPLSPSNSNSNNLFNSVKAKAFAISVATYPQMTEYPNEADYYNEVTGEYDFESYNKVRDKWQADRKSFDSTDNYKSELNSYLIATIPHFLAGTSGNNRVYSPLNVYMALSILAELTDGNSRQQILDLLDSDSIDTLRTQVDALWKANYYNDGRNTSILASSIWLDEDVNYKQSTMDSIAKTYHASSYLGEMGTDEYNKALQEWMNEQTGGILDEQIGEIELNPETILALATTIYYQARWSNEFSESNTTSGTFYADSDKIICDFMYQSNSRKYFEGDTFTSVGQSLDGSGAMYFILPNKGESIDSVLNDSDTIEFILNNKNFRPGKNIMVNLTVPKFDVTSQLELTEMLKELGVTDVFDEHSSDFSPMTNDIDSIYVSQVQHDARVMIDEEGCTATAFTAILADATSAPPDDEINFTLDRPFIFVITGADGLPLFVGVVNQPA